MHLQPLWRWHQFTRGKDCWNKDKILGQNFTKWRRRSDYRNIRTSQQSATKRRRHPDNRPGSNDGPTMGRNKGLSAERTWSSEGSQFNPDSRDLKIQVAAISKRAAHFEQRNSEAPAKRSYPNGAHHRLAEARAGLAEGHCEFLGKAKERTWSLIYSWKGQWRKVPARSGRAETTKW